MKARLYRTSQGFDLITSNNELYHIGHTVKKIGIVGSNFKPSGQLLKQIPNHIKRIFFELQNQSK